MVKVSYRSIYGLRIKGNLMSVKDFKDNWKFMGVYMEWVLVVFLDRKKGVWMWSRKLNKWRRVDS